VQRAREAPQNVVERHVVVPGHDERGGRQAVEEGARRRELARLRALRQVAADRDERRAKAGEVLEERLDEAGFLPPEVQVRHVGDGPHRGASPFGTTTASAPGSTR
jgi:hypothetical protein